MGTQFLIFVIANTYVNDLKKTRERSYLSTFINYARLFIVGTLTDRTMIRFTTKDQIERDPCIS